ncbi:hypothetical protein HN933_02275 [Candidatus Woesearchaeota archaeon]|nr:hypothetical protein [Candidatus Woesearchaeota archaeon]MBT7105656.1 hypothetical protein [Candidatus Woesearchaeota archaeon]
MDFGNRRVLTTEEALAQLEGYVPEKPPQNPTNPPIDPDPDPNGDLEGSVEITGSHILMPQTSTYALGVQALRDVYSEGKCPDHPVIEIAGSRIVRPLTFKENIEARVNDYKTLTNPDGSERTKEERLRLFNRWLDSSCGIAYKAGTTKFKIIPVCKELIEVVKNFNGEYLPINYDKVVGTELDRSNAKYDTLLTKAEVIEHPAWRTAVEDDKELLKDYADIIFTEKKSANKLMSFWTRSNIAQDQLRALFVDNLNDNSSANGSDYLSNYGSFLQVAPSKKP